MKTISENVTLNNQEKLNSISYLTLFTFSSKWDKLLILISITSVFIAGLAMPYTISLVANVFQSMIDFAKSVQRGTSNNGAFLMSMHEFGINYSCVGLVLFTCGYLGTSLIDVAAINQVYRIRVSYLKAVLNQDMAYFDLHQTGDFASKMAEDMIKLEEGIGDKLSSLVYNSTVSIGCIVMALVKGWKLAILCLSTAPITFLLVGLTGKIANELYKKQAQAKGKASVVAEEVLGSIKTVYAFNGQLIEIERYKKPLSEARRIYIKKEFFTGLSMGFLYLCIFGSYPLAFYFGIYLIINEPKKYNADVMFSVFFGIMTALSYFGMIGHLMSTFGSARGAGAQIFHILNKVPSINPLLERGIRPRTIEGTIELKNVFFQYPARPGVTALSDVNITVPSGKTVALVGHSGSGKSSVVSLISRYYDVTEGTVMIDGNDVRKLSVQWLRAQIGLVRQEPVLFDTSVRENIRHGRQDSSDTDIINAARQANAHEFIIKLPAGYDTYVGDRGTSLSGGQKQRIAIARALVRNPRILLLDEATSALDTVSEAKVQEALNGAAKGRTTVIVAHRLSTIRNVDKIYVMLQGKVIEMGSHEELIYKKGVYYDMFKTSKITYSEILNMDIAHEPDREQSKISKDASINDSENLKESKPKVKSLSFCQVLAMNAPEWRTIVLGSISSIISGFSMPLFIIVFGDLFGSMADPDPDHLMKKVKDISIICVCIGCAMGLSNFIETLSFGRAGAFMTERLRLQMFSHLLRQDVAYFESSNSTGALCARLSAEAAYVHGATGQRIGVIFQGVGSIGLALFIALWFEWRVGLVALAFLPLVIVIIWQQGRATYRESVGYAKALENSTKIAVEAVSNIRTVVCLGREHRVVQEYAAQLQPALAPGRRAAHWRGVVGGMSRSIFNFVNAAALTYGGHLIVSDGIAYHNILITTQSLQMASSQAQNAFAYAPDFQKGITAAARIQELLNTKPNITDPDRPVDNFKASGKASLNAVEFKYPNRPTVRVLRGLNLEITQGKTIALVGQSGCGKSTVIQLLQRYYDPGAGTVVLDDIPVIKLRINDVRASYGVVSQEPVLFDRTIRENIAYGDNSRIIFDEEIIEAAKKANIHEFIVSLPLGYDTDIGSKGIQLSGGQKQRVAIARALVRQPALLILDEATSALDSESEKVVQEALDVASAGRTCLMIAHRLSTVRDADVICVISDGRVAESGTHSELSQLRGLYHNLLVKGL